VDSKAGMGFVNDVGQLTLPALSNKGSRNKKKGNKPGGRDNKRNTTPKIEAKSGTPEADKSVASKDNNPAKQKQEGTRKRSFHKPKRNEDDNPPKQNEG
jgi:hypothetical protein